MRPIIAVLGVAATTALAGCGLSDPYATHTRRGNSRAPSTVAVPAPQVAHKGRSAIALLRRFALAWTNWDSHTVAARRAQLTQLADSGLARELRTDGAIAPGAPPGASSAGRLVGAIAQGHGRYLVVLEETARARTLVPQHGYHVYLAVLTASRDGGFKVSEWQPTS